MFYRVVDVITIAANNCVCVRKFLKLSQNSFNSPLGWNIIVVSVFTDEENVAKIIFGLLKVGNPVAD